MIAPMPKRTKKRRSNHKPPPRHVLLNYERVPLAEGTRLQMIRRLEEFFPVACKVDDDGVVHIDGAEIAYIVPLKD